MKTVRILILEDDLRTLSSLLKAIDKLEENLLGEGKDIGVTVLSEFTQVEEYLNSSKANIYDVILLDRDCKAGGSFHVIDFNKYTIDKIIGISSTPPYNEELLKRGVKRIIHKDYQVLDQFSEEVIFQIKDLLQLKS